MGIVMKTVVKRFKENRHAKLLWLTVIFILFDYPHIYGKEFTYQNPRIRITINECWKFLPDGIAFGQRDYYRDVRQKIDENWETVHLPHTWNASDPFDDEEGYRRGISWYRKVIHLNQRFRGKRIFLHFEGANQKADVYVNGSFVGQHIGGYTAFTFDITDYIQYGENKNRNLIAVQVDNSHDHTIPPLSVGYALYGGIYRDVWLIYTEPVHMKLTDCGSNGVYISTPEVSDNAAVVEVRGTVVNHTKEMRNVEVVNTILDAKGEIVHVIRGIVQVAPDGESAFHFRGQAIINPHLWSPDDPYLYRVYTDIFEKEKLMDRVSNPLGFRWFSFDPDEGFFLNGVRVKIRGSNRHQDRLGLGSALLDNQHEKDILDIKKMGANFVRLAHYPQDQSVLNATDQLGLLVWEEIPLVNYADTSSVFIKNTRNMLREMIRQHYNHPSVIIWGSMNEIFLWSRQGRRIWEEEDKSYQGLVKQIASELDSLIHAEDSMRYSAMAINTSSMYVESGIFNVPQIIGLNVYFGWYGGEFNQFGRWMDRQHRNNPSTVFFISEYGAGSDLRLNSNAPERFDFSGNWHRWFYESYINQIEERSYLAGSAIWNQFDFSQPHTGGTILHVNQKGLQTWDRVKKDSYFFFKANWNPEPMVYIASRDWLSRFGVLGDSDSQVVDVYSNLDKVELLHDGISLGKKNPSNIHKATWNVKFHDGANALEARGYADGKIVRDFIHLQFTMIPADFRTPALPWRTIAINVGSKAQFIGEDGLLWLPDQKYRERMYGFDEGNPAIVAKDLIVLRTKSYTPLFYSFREDIHSYRIDVPDGDYDIELFFVEPKDIGAGERVFDVYINDDVFLENIDLIRDYGFLEAVTRCTTVSVSSGNGIDIRFEAQQGNTILNAIKVNKK